MITTKVQTPPPVDNTWFWRLILVVCSCSLCSKFQVYQTAVANNLYGPGFKWFNETQSMARVSLTSDTVIDSVPHHSDWSSAIWSSFIASFPMGKFLGTAVSAEVVDRFGRRSAGIVLSCALSICGVLMTAGFLMESFLTMLLARFLIGVNSAIFMSVTFLMAMESSPKTHRGFFVSLAVIFYGLGDLFGATISLPQLFGSTQLWGYAMAVGCIPSIPCLVVLLRAHESPRYLFLQKQDLSAATSAVGYYQGISNFDDTFEDLYTERHEKVKQSAALCYSDLFVREDLRRASTLAVLLSAGCQVSGITIVMTFSTMIMHRYGMPHNSAALMTLSLAIIKVVTSFPVPWMVERLGRRTCCMIGIGGCAVSNLGVVISVWLWSESAGTHIAFFWTIHMALYNLQAATASSFSGELLDQDFRARGMVLSGCTGWLLAALVSQVFPVIVNHNHFLSFMTTLVILSFSLLYFCYLYLPETCSRPLSEIQAEFKLNKKQSTKLANNGLYTAVPTNMINSDSSLESDC